MKASEIIGADAARRIAKRSLTQLGAPPQPELDLVAKLDERLAATLAFLDEAFPGAVGVRAEWGERAERIVLALDALDMPTRRTLFALLQCRYGDRWERERP